MHRLPGHSELLAAEFSRDGHSVLLARDAGEVQVIALNRKFDHAEIIARFDGTSVSARLDEAYHAVQKKSERFEVQDLSLVGADDYAASCPRTSLPGG